MAPQHQHHTEGMGWLLFPPNKINKTLLTDGFSACRILMCCSKHLIVIKVRRSGAVLITSSSVATADRFHRQCSPFHPAFPSFPSLGTSDPPDRQPPEKVEDQSELLSFLDSIDRFYWLHGCHPRAVGWGVLAGHLSTDPCWGSRAKLD